jgi:hypothetical protein
MTREEMIKELVQIVKKDAQKTCNDYEKKLNGSVTGAIIDQYNKIVLGREPEKKEFKEKKKTKYYKKDKYAKGGIVSNVSRMDE